MTSNAESKDFTKFNLKEQVGFLMSHELHLGTTDSSKSKRLALKVNEQEDTDCDEEKAAQKNFQE